jgi:hypothetical protein
MVILIMENYVSRKSVDQGEKMQDSGIFLIEKVVIPWG